MSEWSPDPDNDRRKRLWTGLGGTLVFVVLGVAIMPLLLQKKTVVVDPSRIGGRDGPPMIARDEPLARRPAARREDSPAPEAGAGEHVATRGFDCMIGPNEIIEIGSPVTGVIQEILVERSDYVEAGQLLARLEAHVEEAAVRVARARAERKVDIQSSQASLELGQKRRDRARQLFESNALSLDEQQEVEAQARLAELELQRAREDRRLAGLELQRAQAALDRRTIRSPVSGYVIERLMAPGEVIDEQTMLRIAQIDPLRVETILPSDWFGRTRRGARAEITPEAPLDQPRSAEVAIVDPIIDGASGTFGIHLLLPNPEHELPAGLRCHVRFLED